jgi:hypothetical protein
MGTGQGQAYGILLKGANSDGTAEYTKPLSNDPDFSQGSSHFELYAAFHN